jgi:hypothetical protein
MREIDLQQVVSDPISVGIVASRLSEDKLKSVTKEPSHVTPTKPTFQMRMESKTTREAE